MELSETKQQALRLLQARQYESAYAFILKALSDHQQDADLNYLAGKVMAIVDADNRSAFDFLNAALEEKPGNARLLEELLNAHIRFSEWDSAYTTLQSLKTTTSERWPLLYLESVIEYERRNYDASLEGIREYIERFPDDANANVLAGKLLAIQGENEESAQRIDAALAAQPSNSVANLERAKRFIASGEIDSATLHLNRAIDGNPYYVEAYNLLAQCLARSGERDEARQAMNMGDEINRRSKRLIGYYKHLFSLEDPSSDESLKAANELHRLKRFKRAEDYYKRIEPGDPIFDESRLPYAKLLFDLARYEEAFQRLQEIRNSEILNRQLRYELYVWAALRSNHEKIARVALEAGIKRFPESKPLKQAQALFESIKP